jgi:hypothetical protein
MSKFRWQVFLTIGLIGVSILIYGIQDIFFHDTYHAMYYLLLDLAYAPIQILVVTLLLDKLLRIREKQNMTRRLNMVIGVFFTEVGSNLLGYFSKMDPEIDTLRNMILNENDWNEKSIKAISLVLKSRHFHIKCAGCELEDLRLFLLDKRKFLLNLLENQNLMEHDTFTELLWAVFHLAEELVHRERAMEQITETDKKHLEGDIVRAYKLLVVEWVAYMKHLKAHYPYLFSLALRINPFDPNAKWEVS